MKFARLFANLTILGAIIVLLLLGLYAYFYFPISLTGFGEILIYYILPTVLLILLIASLRLPDTYKINLALALLSIALTLYAIEGILTILDSTAFLAKMAGQPFDTRTRLEVIEQFAEEGIEAVPSICPSLFLEKDYRLEVEGKEILPLGGISNALTVSCNESGKYLIYQSDEYGFRNPKGLAGIEQLDIAVVGDSFAFGSCVENDAVSIIRQTYKNTRNLGCGGNGPLLELATLREYAKPLKPKIVLWFYYEGNDLTGLAFEKESEILLRYLENNYSQNLLPVQSEIDQQLEMFVNKEKGNLNVIKGSGLFKFLVLENLLRRTGFHRSRFSTGDLDSLKKVLIVAKEDIAAWEGQLYFVYLPEWQRFNNPAGANSDRDRVLRLMNELDIPTIDIYEAFAAHDDPLSLFPYRRHGHYTAEGYRIVAETILQFIEKRTNNYRNHPSAK